MGTMIQTHQLDEAAFRGQRFRDHPSDLRGANDLLVLTRPDVIEGIHADYLAAGADVISTNTFNANAVSMSDYGLESVTGEMNEAAARIARRSADAAEAREPDRPRFVAGALGPTTRTASLSPDVNDPGARSVTWDELVDRLHDRRARPGRRWRGHPAHRDHLRHPQCQGGDLRGREPVRRARVPPAGHDQRHHHGRLRQDALGPDGGGILGERAARPTPERRAQLCPRREAATAISPGALGHRGRVRVGISQRRSAERVRWLRRAATRDRERPGPAHRGRVPELRGWLLRHHPRPYPRHRGGGGRSSAPTGPDTPAPHPAVGPGAARPSRPTRCS